MNRLLHISAAIITAIAAALVVVVLPSQPVGASRPVAPANAATSPPAMMPSATPEPEFSATLSLTPARPSVLVGNTLTLTAGLVTAGCGYFVMELTVREDPAAAPLFAHIDPPDDIIDNGVLFPNVWTFRAERPGTARFLAETFGETGCNGWQWHYENATSPLIEVYDLPVQVWLPTISSP